MSQLRNHSAVRQALEYNDVLAREITDLEEEVAVYADGDFDGNESLPGLGDEFNDDIDDAEIEAMLAAEEAELAQQLAENE